MSAIKRCRHRWTPTGKGMVCGKCGLGYAYFLLSMNDKRRDARGRFSRRPVEPAPVPAGGWTPAELARSGGKARAARLTPERRSEIARVAGLAGAKSRAANAKARQPLAD